MANAIYPDYADRLLNPGGAGNGAEAVDWLDDTITVSLHSSANTFDDSHEDFADLSGLIDSQREALTNPAVQDGVADADDVTFAAVASGSTVANYVLSKSTGNPANDQVLFYFDTDKDGAISVPTNDGDIEIIFAVDGIVSLVPVA